MQLNHEVWEMNPVVTDHTALALVLTIILINLNSNRKCSFALKETDTSDCFIQYYE